MFRLLRLSAFALTALALPAFAAPSLQERLATPPQNAFEHGTYQVLRAVEAALQARYSYGLGDTFSRTPVIRLPLPGGPNPTPKQASADTLGEIIDTLLSDLETARATLASASPEPFTMPLADIWLDVNMNGTQDKGEGVVELLGETLLGRRATRDFAKSELAAAPPAIRFDQADHAWLTAYTHMVSGALNTFRAYDPAPIMADLAEARAALANVPQLPEFYDLAALRAELEALRTTYSALGEELNSLNDERNALNASLRQIKDDIKKLYASESSDRAERLAKLEEERRIIPEALKRNQEKSREINAQRSPLRNQIRNIESNLPETRRRGFDAAEFSSQIDTLYIIFTALAQEPDAARFQAAAAHWREMVRQNRSFWTLVKAETDNENEWIPNPQQTSPLSLEVTSEMAEAWQMILTEGEALLDGSLLIPHPLLPEGYGISLKLFAENPAPLEFVGTAHGRSLYPFAAKGPTMSAINWSRFSRLTGGNAGGFALWFN